MDILHHTSLLPSYDRTLLQEKIIHIGLGAFHRGHQAFILDQLLRLDQSGQWGICAISLFGSSTSSSIIEQMGRQDNLYTVIERYNQTAEITVVGSIINTMQRQKVGNRAILEKLLEPQVAIITLTITEKGYCLHPNGEGLDLTHPDILHDLAHPEDPITVPALLFYALKRRSKLNRQPITILSCDNIPENGLKLKNAIISYAQRVDPSFISYIDNQVAFPCSMVDRIVPATTEKTLHSLEQQWNIDDPCAIETEPFLQWVIEDQFAGEIPSWDKIKGVSIVKDVCPYEEMKLRMLNGTHSFFAYVGLLSGYRTVSECANHPLFEKAALALMQYEQQETLTIKEIDLVKYAHNLIQRFQNNALEHQLTQIATDGSQKIPQRFIESILWRETHNLDSPLLILSIAAWITYVEQQVDQLADSYQDRLAQIVHQAKDHETLIMSLLQSNIFPPQFHQSPKLSSQIIESYLLIEQLGAEKALFTLLESTYPKG